MLKWDLIRFRGKPATILIPREKGLSCKKDHEFSLKPEFVAVFIEHWLFFPVVVVDILIQMFFTSFE
ncbi:MAG: hypothetical protein K0S32_2474 [Bacteroidetes bacterium]|jgi:hypothetical protein|nr:hypothetical protein [Bacteroidota bacterium]